MRHSIFDRKPFNVTRAHLTGHALVPGVDDEDVIDPESGALVRVHVKRERFALIRPDFAEPARGHVILAVLCDQTGAPIEIDHRIHTGDGGRALQWLTRDQLQRLV